jgi:hypothetical protein
MPETTWKCWTHNLEVAGSNPARATREVTGQRPSRRLLEPGAAQLLPTFLPKTVRSGPVRYGPGPMRKPVSRHAYPVRTDPIRTVRVARAGRQAARLDCVRGTPSDLTVSVLHGVTQGGLNGRLTYCSSSPLVCLVSGRTSIAQRTSASSGPELRHLLTGSSERRMVSPACSTS